MLLCGDYHQERNITINLTVFPSVIYIVSTTLALRRAYYIPEHHVTSRVHLLSVYVVFYVVLQSVLSLSSMLSMS
jgi:uncharacterized membrane protein YGL010W